MPYRLDIPGQVSEFQLRAIEAVATLVPENGSMVEVGSLFGLSSWAWAKSIPQSASIFCVDPWEGNEGVQSMERQYGVQYGKEQFEIYTADCPNLTAIQAYSPRDVQDWDRPIDLYYEDAVHHNPTLGLNIDFWTSHLRPTGIVCGDDYRPRFADVRAAAEAQAKARGRKLWVVDFFWCILPDPELVPAAVRVAEILAGLVEEVARARAGIAANVRVHPVMPLPKILPIATPAPFYIRVVNDGGVAWPVAEASEIQLLAEFVRDDGVVVSSQTHGIGVSQLRYDEPVNIAIDLPFGSGLPEQAILKLSPTTDGVVATGATVFEQRIAIDVTPAASRHRLEELLSLAAGAEVAPRRGKGWFPAERIHSWTKGGEAELMLDLDGASAGKEWLTIALRPFTAGVAHPAQRLSIVADGVEIFFGKLSSRASLSVPLPARKGATLQLLLKGPDACRPSDVVAGNSDHRLLGFAVESLMVSSTPLVL